MIVTSVCRLCMSEKELRWVFDEGITGESDMKTIIFITTGVEVCCFATACYPPFYVIN